MKAFQQDLEGADQAVWVPGIVVDHARHQITLTFYAFISAATYRAKRGSVERKSYILKDQDFTDFLTALDNETFSDVATDWAKARKDMGPADDRVSFFESAVIVEV